MDPLRSHPPRGLIVEFPTLLDSRGGPDRSATLGLLERIEGRADGLLLCGPEAGLGPDLKIEQRAELLDLVAAATGLPLLAFITHPSRSESAECAEVLTGIDPGLFLVDAPLLVRSNRDLLNWLDFLGQRFQRPLILYNHPRLMNRIPTQTKRRNIRTAILKRAAAESSCLKGLIFKGEFRRLLNYHQAVRSKSGFLIYDAQEIRFLDRPSTSGVVSAGAALIPGIWAKVVRAALHRGPSAPLAETLACGRAARALARSLPKEPRRLILELLAEGQPPGFLTGLGLERWGLLDQWANEVSSETEPNP